MSEYKCHKCGETFDSRRERQDHAIRDMLSRLE